jgi:hypothetical protein
MTDFLSLMFVDLLEIVRQVASVVVLPHLEVATPLQNIKLQPFIPNLLKIIDHSLEFPSFSETIGSFFVHLEPLLAATFFKPVLFALPIALIRLEILSSDEVAPPSGFIDV